jgi:endonuclease YncB( thermonuclease family)
VPAYSDDIIPAHRMIPNPSTLAIGDVQFIVPPSFIAVNSVSNVSTIHGLRQKNSIKTKSGYSQTEIRIDLWFVGAEQVNGIKMSGPEGGHYYMDGLRSLIAQFRRTPILPISNTKLNQVHGIHSVVLVNLIVNTVPGFPNTLKATLVLQKTTVAPYIMRPDEDYPDMICWPLFRWYYQQMLTTGSRSRAAETFLQPVTTKHFTGDFSFMLMDENELDRVHAPEEAVLPYDHYMKIVDLEGEAVIDDMSISLSNMVAPLQTQAKTCPTHQYISGMDTSFLIRMTCDDVALANLTEIKNVAEEYSISHRDRIVTGFVGIENELVQLFGVNYIMIQSLESETMEGFPGWNRVSLMAVSFDRSQRRGEKPHQLEYAEGTFDDLETIFEGDLSHIDHAVVVERLMNGLELYPDLELPTYREVGEALKNINQQRLAGGLTPMEFKVEPPSAEDFHETRGAIFVDPDFYMSYNGLMPGGLLYDKSLVDSLGRVTNLDGGSKPGDVTGPSGSDQIFQEVPPPVLPDTARTATVYWVVDGDTFDIDTLDDKGARIRIRIIGVDTPEKGWEGEADEPIAEQAKQALIDLIYGKTIRYRLGDKPELLSNGKYRLLAYVWTESGYSVNYHMLKEGLGRRLVISPNTDYSDAWEYAFRLAQAKKIGLWALDRKTVIGSGGKTLEGDWGPGTIGKPSTVLPPIGVTYRKLDMLSSTDWLYPLIDAASKDADIDPNLVAAVIWMENGESFDNVKQSAVSDQDAVGIMQVLGPTAVSVGVSAHDARTDPKMNVLAGTRFLKDKLREFDGNIPLAVAAYNAGGGGVREMIAMAGGSKNWDDVHRAITAYGLEMIRQTPSYAQDHSTWYAQTLPYVTKVMRKYGYYQPAGSSVSRETGLLTPDVKMSTEIPSWIWSAGEDRFVELDWDPADRPGGIPHGEQVIQSCFHDMMRYNRRGQMIRAFPTYCLLFIDEGPWLDGRRVWTRYFAYHSLTSIGVTKERGVPADTCHITLTNVYSALSHSERLPQHLLHPKGSKDAGVSAIGSTIYEEVWPRVDQAMVDYRAKGLNQMSIRPGARIHLRIGYGSSASELPIVFNGTVAEINVDDEIDLIAQGDGIELTNTFTAFGPEQTTSMIEMGNEPFNIVTGILGERSAAGYFWGDAAEQSPFGIEHFGTLKKYKVGSYDNLSGKKVRLKEWGALSNFPFWLYNEMDLIKNVYSSTFKVYMDPATLGKMDQIMTGWFRNGAKQGSEWYKFFDGEENLQLYLGSRTPWDIFNTLAHATPDYVVAVVPHQFRSTLFWGMPHYPVRYGYVRKSKGGRDDYSSYLDKSKTFIQFHLFSSETDILHNGIKASSMDLVHNCAAQYTLAGTLKVAPTVFADDTIKSDLIRTEVIDSGIYHDIFMFIPDSWLEFAGVNMGGEDRAMQIARSHVRDSFRHMYQGELILIGDPSLKPHDIFNLSDSYTNMFGDAQVGRVVHQLSAETGFITSVKPDLIVSLRDSPFAVWLNVASRHLVPMGLTMIRGIQLWKSASRILKNYSWARAVQDVTAAGVAVKQIAASTVRAYQLSSTFGQGRRVIAGIDALRHLRTGVSLYLAGAGLVTLGASLVVLAVWQALFVAFDRIARGLFLWAQNRNVIGIQPLWYKGMPYVAGIDGFTKIIPGIKDPRYYADSGIDRDPVALPPYQGVIPADSNTGQWPQASASAVFFFPVDVGPSYSQAKVGDRFGAKEGRTNAHQGVDFPSNDGGEGMHIRAIGDGKVKVVMTYQQNQHYNPAWGSVVVIEHTGAGAGYESVYAHLSKFAPAAGQGVHVKRGDVIGYMGGIPRDGFTAGYFIKDDVKMHSSDGAHLHFALHHNGVPVDPMPLLRSVPATPENSTPTRER